MLLRAGARLPELAIWVVGDALFTDDRAYAAARTTNSRSRAGRPGQAFRFSRRHSRSDEGGRHSRPPLDSTGALRTRHRRRHAGAKARRASRAGGPIEILADGSAGKLVSPGDTGSLEEALPPSSQVSRRMRTRLGETGRKRAESEYAPSCRTEKTDAVLARFT